MAVVVVRSYEPQDATATWRAYEAAIRGTAVQYYSPEQIDAWCPRDPDLTRWGAARSHAWTVVAERDGDVVGFSDLTTDGVLDMLFVTPAAGGRGAARALVEAVLAEARRRGLTRVTTEASRAARPVFERLGFVVDRENLDHAIRDVVVPNFSMHIDLPEPVPAA